MARDYAARNRKPAPKPAGLPGWIWLTAGLSMGLVVAVLVYIGRPAQPMPLATPPQAAVSKTRPSIPVPPREEPRFSFYEELENGRVVVPREDAQPKTAPAAPQPAVKPPPAPSPAAPVDSTVAVAPTPAAPAAAQTPAAEAQYLIVVGSFREQGNADGHRAKLALTGNEAAIDQVADAQGQTLYRVRLGPERGLARAQDVLAQVKAAGFDGRLVKLP
jgi:cell division protein FtsN